VARLTQASLQPLHDLLQPLQSPAQGGRLGIG
jgi:hypothetical protein